jgi:hypothetical protein
MAREHGNEEASNHNKSPYCAGDKSLFLLLIFIKRGCFGFLKQRQHRVAGKAADPYLLRDRRGLSNNSILRRTARIRSSITGI